MIGTWAWQRDDDNDLTKVKVIPYDKDLIGRVVHVGSYLKGYHYKEDDLYWEKFQFEDGNKFVCYNLIRYEDGGVAGETSSGKINYKNGTIEINVTGAKDPIRTWKRLDE